MDKRVILAVAGSGKTYTLCNNVDPTKSNLIIAYTNQNVRNIKKELYDRFKKIPVKTKIYTFHSFIYNFFIRPYEPIISKHFSYKIKSNGVSLMDPPPQRINNKFNYRYKKDTDVRHYYLLNNVYCSRMSKLIIKTKKTKEYDLAIFAMDKINMFFENIYVDEFQDFREYDYELLEKIIKYSNNIFLVGDYYQHSVNAKNNSGKPFKSLANFISYNEYLELLKKMGLTVDTRTLIFSRRCSNNICDFIKSKLQIDIESEEINNGSIILCKDEKKIRDVLENKEIVKLMMSSANKYSLNSINWGYSKGDTYEDVCVLLTSDFENIDLDDFEVKDISPITINKIYVAFSRTKGNLYIIKKSNFDKFKNEYIKNENKERS